MADEQSTTETATSLPHFTGLTHSGHVTDDVVIEVDKSTDKVDISLATRVQFNLGPIISDTYTNDTKAANAISTSTVSQPTVDLQCGRLHTLGYYKSQWHADYPAKESAYLSMHEDTNTTCCGVNVIEIGQQISKYKPQLLTSPWKICCCFPGSFCYYLCHKRWLIIEQFVYFIVFVFIVFITAFNRYNLIPNVISATNNLGTLVAFLLGLYVSLSISRWWRLRADGIGNIWGGSSGIATLLGPMYEVYRDKIYSNDVDRNKQKEGETHLKRILIHLKRIQRYCQLSMAMVFSTNMQQGFDMDHLEELEIIAREDRDAIEELGSRQEYSWSLVSREVRLMMYECPDFMDQSLILSVQEMITKGRGGAGLIAAQLGSHLPLTYAHGVTLIAKVYNIVMCITSGIQFVNLWLDDIKKKDPTMVAGRTNAEIVRDSPIIFAWSLSFACSFLLVRTSVICMLLHLCQQLANPFDNDIMSFPGWRYIKFIYLDFEILLGFDIKTQWMRICDKFYVHNTGSKQQELNDLVHMAQDCGILHDEKRAESLRERKTERELKELKKMKSLQSRKICSCCYHRHKMS